MPHQSWYSCWKATYGSAVNQRLDRGRVRQLAKRQGGGHQQVTTFDLIHNRGWHFKLLPGLLNQGGCEGADEGLGKGGGRR